MSIQRKEDPNVTNARDRTIKALLEITHAMAYVERSNNQQVVRKVESALRELRRAQGQLRAAIGNAYERGGMEL